MSKKPQNILDEGATSYYARRYFAGAAVVTLVLSLLTGHWEPFFGCVICAAFVLPLLLWFEDMEGER